MKGKISISETGAVRIAASVQMQDFEIAELFDVMIPTVRAHIRAILKLGVTTTNIQHSGTFLGNTFYPDYYGLDMVVTLAFRIQSPHAELFRKWILNRVTEKEKNIIPQIFVSINSQINKELD